MLSWGKKSNVRIWTSVTLGGGEQDDWRSVSNDFSSVQEELSPSHAPSHEGKKKPRGILIFFLLTNKRRKAEYWEGQGSPHSPPHTVSSLSSALSTGAPAESLAWVLRWWVWWWSWNTWHDESGRNHWILLIDTPVYRCSLLYEDSACDIWTLQ